MHNTWYYDNDGGGGGGGGRNSGRGVVVIIALSMVLNAPGPAQVDVAGPAAFDSLVKSSDTKPCSARGAGSTPLLVKRSASDAKHLRAPSATCEGK
jgi:hypothetical protein